VAAIPLPIQERLLQAIKQSTAHSSGGGNSDVHVRIIAALTQGGSEVDAPGGLGEGLKYQLSAISIDVPPLRERKEDIFLLAEYFIDCLNRGDGHEVESVAAEVWPLLLKHDWPGNVRELRDVVESAVSSMRSPVLGVLDLPEKFRRPASSVPRDAVSFDGPLDDVLEEVERQTILSALRHSRGKRSQAARSMKISRSRLYRRMEALGIHQKKNTKDAPLHG